MGRWDITGTNFYETNHVNGFGYCWNVFQCECTSKHV